MSMPTCSGDMWTMYGMRLDNCATDEQQKKKKSAQIWVLSQKLTWHCGETLISIQSLAFYSILASPLLAPSPQNTVRVANSKNKEISKCWKTTGSFRDPWPSFREGILPNGGAKWWFTMGSESVKNITKYHQIQDDGFQDRSISGCWFSGEPCKCSGV